LRLLAGLDSPTSGTIRIGGRVVNAVSPRDRDVAMVFQRPALYPHWTVRRNLQFSLSGQLVGGWLRRLVWRAFVPARYRVLREQESAGQERITTTAHQLGLEPYLERRPGQLSGGERQRAALGRALVRQPAVFLLDEPFSSLDPPQRAELRRELHLLHRRLRATMIYVTHDQVEAMTLADRLVVLGDGTVQQADRPLGVYQQPRNRYVAGFIGWPSMNFLDGWLEPADGGLHFRTAGWSMPVPDRAVRAWGPHAGKKVTLGVRPEDVQVAQPGERCMRLATEVALVESLGRSHLVTLRKAGTQLAALQDGWDGLVEGQTLEIGWDVERTHLFDGCSGLVLYNKRPAG
jgi:multiple sugar transport system ATP-binding protein